MDWYHGVYKAYEIDLEEIRILTEVARTAPGPVAHSVLMIMMEELMEAMHWHMMLMMRPGYTESHYDYEYNQPPYGTPFTADENKEGQK
ncbi:MAG TPA: hypothetical protein GXX35_04645 [Thermoanaerobacterales bacterium]|nr:hypothetical protein [Thermoanaerobacterales bacterium]